MLRAEFEAPKESDPCPCCGGKTTSLTRFVYENDDAYAIYYVKFSNNHPKRIAVGTVSLGEWGDGSSPEQRVAFTLQIGVSDSEYQVAILSAAESPWREAKTIGRTLDREEALAHPRIKEVYRLTDYMVAEDLPLKNYLDGQVNAA